MSENRRRVRVCRRSGLAFRSGSALAALLPLAQRLSHKLGRCQARESRTRIRQTLVLIQSHVRLWLLLSTITSESLGRGPGHGDFFFHLCPRECDLRPRLRNSDLPPSRV